MTTLTFRNRAGDLIDVPSVPATRFKNEFGAIFERATQGGAVAITRHDAPKAVLVSYEEFKALVDARMPALDALTARFDALLARMQTPHHEVPKSSTTGPCSASTSRRDSTLAA